ncbi:hypothetical protein [Caldilinea sp.]|uniref:hypothetical protein n=1 Tax=Caldilinea sp. TaxID=2293560 RepID=UPI002BF2965E|nr:hypothetical protein [Anaerolineales bacterium]HQY95315.1 hypothetical protein [Caldilinea sp.]
MTRISRIFADLIRRHLPDPRHPRSNLIRLNKYHISKKLLKEQPLSFEAHKAAQRTSTGISAATFFVLLCVLRDFVVGLFKQFLNRKNRP